MAIAVDPYSHVSMPSMACHTHTHAKSDSKLPARIAITLIKPAFDFVVILIISSIEEAL